MADETPATESQARRRLARAIEIENRIKVIGIFATFFLVVVLLVGGAIAVTKTHDKLSELQDSSIRAACSDRLVADGFAAAGRALASPPAPNPERGAAVNDIIRAANRLTHSDRICARGIPAPLVLTPASTTKGG